MAGARSYHRLRRRIQIACFVLFCALPFFNVLRFDIPRQRAYFAGYEIWINEFGIFYFTLMFLLFLIVAAALFYGRIYCGYLCPQMIFSEASLRVEERLKRLVTKKFIRWTRERRALLARVLFYAAVLAGSVFLGFVFIAYFVEPRDLIRRLARLDVETAGGIAGAVTTAITFADFTWVRQKFCTTVCPYGYLQGMLQDGNTLVVSYQPDEQGCIECKKCVRVCHMGIDIRNSAHQMECVHCGECIDACEDVLGRLKAPRVGLIHYTWGEGGERLGAPGPWWRKLGIRDTKRGIAVAVMMLYGAGLLYSLSSRRGLLVNIMPERSTLYTVGPDGRIHNRFRLRAANRQNAAVSVRLALARLERARILLPEEALKIGAFETRDLEFDVAAPAAGGPPPGVSHFQFIVQTEPGQKTELVPMTFIMPEKRQP